VTSVPEVISQRYEEHVELSRLVPHPANPNESDLGLLGELIDANGFATPVLAQESTGLIIDGEHRWIAAGQHGMTGLPVVWLDVDDDQRDRLLASLNESTRRGRNDEAKLVALLTGLAQQPRGLEGTGFDGDDLDALIAAMGGAGGGPGLNGDPDDVPEPPEEPVSALGELWRLGEHRLLIGDSTDPDDIARLMSGETADMVFTDPPYNADYSSRVDKQRRKPWGGIANDAMPEAEYETFLAQAFAVIPKVTADGAAVYVWTDWHHYSLVQRVYRERFLQKALIIWDKTHFGLGTYYRTQHELLLFGVNGSSVATWNAGHDERDVWSVSRDPVSGYAHPTQKPCELAERAISNSSPEGAVILDLFGGSGSTLIAAHRLGRTARLCELDPKYADVIIQRWVDRTGQAATREDGSPWPGMAQT
jgi:DNA modification methylase